MSQNKEEIERRCQWKGCGEGATAHAQYDYKSHGEIAQDDHGATLGFSVMHADLCPTHLGELKAGPHGAREIGRGRCSAKCPTSW